MVIASLFLPSTIAFESEVATPDVRLEQTDLLHAALTKSINSGDVKNHAGANPAQAAFLKPPHQRQLSHHAPKSIVDDLKDKVCAVIYTWIDHTLTAFPVSQSYSNLNAGKGVGESVCIIASSRDIEPSDETKRKRPTTCSENKTNASTTAEEELVAI